MTEAMGKSIQALFENEEFVANFNSIEDFADMRQLFKDNGVDIEDQDLNDLLESLLVRVEKKDGELSADEMDEVSGGFIGWVIFGVAAGIVGGVSAYKLRTTINSATNTCRRK